MPPRREFPEVTLLVPACGKDLEIAGQLGIRTTEARDPSVWQLVRSDRGLCLHAPAAAGSMVLALSTTQGPLAHRLRSARRTEPLPRAIGLPRRQTPPFVVDATAGLCRDAMVLAMLGCRVTAIERIPALAMLATEAVAGSNLADKLQVVAGDAAAWLRALPAAAAPAIVYLDPMFAESRRAQVKKDMQICRALAGPPDDPAELFAAARAAARERVVVKRHPDLPALADGVSFTVEGERVRFDVYLRS